MSARLLLLAAACALAASEAEDLEPRLVTLAAGEPREILAIVSRRDNVVGAADLDGDGEAEIAAVTTPHIGGTLRVYRRRRGELREIAALSGFSNHVYGSPELGLSAPVAAGGRTRLVVPDASRLSLRVIELRGAKLVEVSRCPIPGAMAAAIKSALMDCGTAVR